MPTVITCDSPRLEPSTHRVTLATENEHDVIEVGGRKGAAGSFRRPFGGARAGYSLLSAVIGSTPAARLAGTYAATSAVSTVSPTASAIVAGSVGVSPNNIPEAKRVVAQIMGRPRITPAHRRCRVLLEGDSLSCRSSGLVVRSLAERGALHQQLGERERAIEYYDRFIAAWRSADARLQPMVERARQAVQAIRTGSAVARPPG